MPLFMQHLCMFCGVIMTASKMQEAHDWVDTHDDEAPKPRLIAAALAGDVMPIEPLKFED